MGRLRGWSFHPSPKGLHGLKFLSLRDGDCVRLDDTRSLITGLFGV